MEFLINDTFFSFSSFNNALIYGREDFFILAVLYFFVLNFFSLLIFIFRAYFFTGKRCFILSFFKQFLANLRHKFVLLVSNDCMFKVLNPSLLTYVSSRHSRAMKLGIEAQLYLLIKVVQEKIGSPYPPPYFTLLTLLFPTQP